MISCKKVKSFAKVFAGFVKPPVTLFGTHMKIVS